MKVKRTTKIKNFSQARKVLKRFNENNLELIFKNKDFILYEKNFIGYSKGISQISFKRLNVIDKIGRKI